VLFPTWHRPYVGLYEQAVQQAALGIAQQYSDTDRWTAAARNLRVPFWDWAASAVPPDEIIALENVDITTPNGDQSVPNPFLRYTFNPIDPSFTSPWDGYQTTVRHPEDSDPVDALKSHLSSSGEQLTTQTYNLLTRVSTWPAFSNHSPDDGGSSSNSLEAIHDGIHVTVGGPGGHMRNPAVAAFDPIFFLHHCNVDHLLSLWAAVHPGKWVTPGPSDQGTFTIPANVRVDVNTDLTPFWNGQDSFWISSGTTSTGALQYSYPEFNNLDLNDRDAVRTAIANIINQKYGGGSSPLPGRGGFGLFAQPSAGGVAAEAVASAKSAAGEITHLFHSRGGPAHTAHGGQGGQGGQVVLHDYSARIHFKKYELGGSFTVLIFLGDVPKDPSQWRKCDSFVGAHHAFVNSAASQCGNCRNQADVYSEGFVHLNSSIAKRSGLSSYEPEKVVPYLKEKLHWRVQSGNRGEVELGKLPSLEVTVAQTPLTQEPGAPFPIPGRPVYHHHITYGRPGGARHAQA